MWSRDWVRESVVVPSRNPLQHRIDRLVAARLAPHHKHSPRLQALASRHLLVLAGAELAQGRSVVVEAVADRRLRAGLRGVAADHGADLLQVEAVCSDRAVHRARLSSRHGYDWIRHLDALEAGRYRSPDPSACVVVDTTRPLDDLVSDLADRLGGRTC